MSRIDASEGGITVTQLADFVALGCPTGRTEWAITAAGRLKLASVEA